MEALIIEKLIVHVKIFLPELFIKTADTFIYLQKYQLDIMIFSNIYEPHSVCWLVYIKCRHFLPQRGEPILPHLLRYGPIAVDNHSFMGRCLASAATSARE